MPDRGLFGASRLACIGKVETSVDVCRVVFQRGFEVRYGGAEVVSLKRFGSTPEGVCRQYAGPAEQYRDSYEAAHVSTVDHAGFD